MSVKGRLIPAVTLALITPFLAEVLSSCTPVEKFFNPTTLIFLVLGYGLPVLIIRDLFLRWKLSLPGLFLLGLAYGVYNEGVLAKTLLRSEHVPIDAFDHYLFLGINWPWSFLIVPWHALHATIFPIILISWLFPSVRYSTWLSRTGLVVSSGLMLLLGIVGYFKIPEPKPPVYLFVFFSFIILFVILSRLMPRQTEFPGTEGVTTWRSAIAGFLFYPVFVLGICMAAGMRLPEFVICLVGVTILAGYYRLIRPPHWFTLTACVLFVMGDYLFLTGFDAIVQIGRGSIPGLITALVVFSFFVGGIIWILRGRTSREELLA